MGSVDRHCVRLFRRVANRGFIGTSARGVTTHVRGGMARCLGWVGVGGWELGSECEGLSSVLSFWSLVFGFGWA